MDSNVAVKLKTFYTYQISKNLIEFFAKEALKNVSGINQLNETLAYIVGHKNENHVVADEIIFPKQRGSSSDVEDLGK